MDNDITDHEAKIMMLQESIEELKIQLGNALVDIDYYKNLLDEQAAAFDASADAQYEALGGDENTTIDGITFDNINDLI